DDPPYYYTSVFLTPSKDRVTGLTGGCTLSGRSSIGSSPVALAKIASTAGRQVRPPQTPIPARVLSLTSRADALYFSAVSTKSSKLTSSHLQTINLSMGIGFPP